ncbi:MAG: phosphotransferase, partial [Chloroflexi bacterium]|nr:phosphotransferase [Chloroflexota bacterium]
VQFFIFQLESFTGGRSQLHNVPVKPVVAALEQSGFSADEFSAVRQFAELSRYFEDDKLESLRPGMEWLVKKRPMDESLAVCHGDFHPANIMVESGKITGVIDWPGAALAAPEHDIGTTVVLIKVAAAAVYPEARPMLEYVSSTYLESYRSLASLDMEKVDYHTARRCFRAFTRASASLVPGIRPDLLPRAGYPWSKQSAMAPPRPSSCVSPALSCRCLLKPVCSFIRRVRSNRPRITPG